MSILIGRDTKVMTQGITGKTGAFHTRICRDYANGKNCFVAGVNPMLVSTLLPSRTAVMLEPFPRCARTIRPLAAFAPATASSSSIKKE